MRIYRGGRLRVRPGNSDREKARYQAGPGTALERVEEGETRGDRGTKAEDDECAGLVQKRWALALAEADGNGSTSEYIARAQCFLMGIPFEQSSEAVYVGCSNLTRDRLAALSRVGRLSMALIKSPRRWGNWTR